MSIDIKMENGLTTLTCQGEMTIVQIADFKKAISEIMPGSKEVVIDLSGIENIDISCLQLLCSANRSFENSNKKMTAKGNHSDLIRDNLSESGYNQNGECPEAPCGNCFWKGESE